MADSEDNWVLVSESLSPVFSISSVFPVCRAGSASSTLCANSTNWFCFSCKNGAGPSKSLLNAVAEAHGRKTVKTAQKVRIKLELILSGVNLCMVCLQIWNQWRGQQSPNRSLPVYFSVSYFYSNCNHMVLIVKACCGKFHKNETFQVFVFPSL